MSTEEPSSTKRPLPPAWSPPNQCAFHGSGINSTTHSRHLVGDSRLPSPEQTNSQLRRLRSARRCNYGIFGDPASQGAQEISERGKILCTQALNKWAERRICRQETVQDAGTEFADTGPRPAGVGAAPWAPEELSPFEAELQGRSAIGTTLGLGCGRAAALSKARQNSIEKTNHVINATVMRLIKQVIYLLLDSVTFNFTFSKTSALYTQYEHVPRGSDSLT
jgi:hypothetical protein